MSKKGKSGIGSNIGINAAMELKQFVPDALKGVGIRAVAKFGESVNQATDKLDQSLTKNIEKLQKIPDIMSTRIINLWNLLMIGILALTYIYILYQLTFNKGEFNAFCLGCLFVLGLLSAYYFSPKPLITSIDPEIIDIDCLTIKMEGNNLLLGSVDVICNARYKIRIMTRTSTSISLDLQSIKLKKGSNTLLVRFILWGMLPYEYNFQIESTRADQTEGLGLAILGVGLAGFTLVKLLGGLFLKK